MKVSREEHIKFCKREALKCIEHGDIPSALDSIISDLRRHDITKHHPRIEIGLLLRRNGNLNEESNMIDFINGFK